MLTLMLSAALAADYEVPYDPEAYDKAMELSAYGGYGYLGGVAVTAAGAGLAFSSDNEWGLLGSLVDVSLGGTAMTVGSAVLAGGALKAGQVLGNGGVEVSPGPGIAALLLLAVPTAGYTLANRWVSVTEKPIDDSILLSLSFAAAGGIVLAGPLGAVQRVAVRNGHADLDVALDLQVVPLITPEGSGLAVGARF